MDSNKNQIVSNKTASLVLINAYVQIFLQAMKIIESITLIINWSKDSYLDSL